MAFEQSLAQADQNTFQAIEHERERQESTLGMIASENHVLKAVLEAQGSVLTNNAHAWHIVDVELSCDSATDRARCEPGR